MRLLEEAGFTPESVRVAVNAKDLSLLVHTSPFKVSLGDGGR